MNNKLSQELCHAYNGQEEHLQHHGIKNMHWGVKNGPPYPLDKKVSARIKKGKNEKTRYTKKELEEMHKNQNSRKYKKQKVGFTHLMDTLERFVSDVNNFYKDPQAKGTKYYSGERIIDTTTNVANLIYETDGKAYRTLNRPGHKATIDDARLCNNQRNYSYTHADAGLTNNCGKCAATMYLRSLGYDVQAGRAAKGVLNTAGQYWFDGAKAYKQKGAVNTYNQMASFGNQGKGMLDIRHRNGGGHAVYFQNERGRDGKIHTIIYDGQIGKRYDKFSDFLKYEHADTSQFSTVTRLDTATPNWKKISEDSVCRVWKQGAITDSNNLYKVTDPVYVKANAIGDNGYLLYNANTLGYDKQVSYIRDARQQYGHASGTGRT